MANSDKNIRITTSKNKTTYPNIVFTGSAAGSSVITLEVLDDNTLSFTSNEGQVFSIDSNLSTGTIWAVSDISGVPLLSSSAGGTVGLAVYGGIVGIGQTKPLYKLDLKGSFGLASSNDNLYNFIFNNSAASGSNSLQIRSANSILLYNSGNTFYTGFKSNAAANVTYTLPTTDGSSGQFLQTNGTGTLTWATATGGSGGTGSTAGVGQGGQYEMAYYPGTGLSVIGSNTFTNNTATGVVSITHSTVSTDFSNGAFKVTGGVGIGGSLYVGGIGASITGVTFSNSTITRGTWNGTAISPTYGGTGLNNSSATGLLQYSGGTASVITTSAALASIISDETGTAGKLVFSTSPVFTTSVTTDSGSFSVFNTTATTINAFGAATTLSIGASTGKATFNSTDNSSSTTTGTLAISGGAGFAKSVSIGGRLQMFNGANFTAFVSSASGNTVYTLPATSPATGSSVLQSTAQGVMSWVPMVASSSGAGSGTVAIPDAQYRIAFYAGTGASVSSTNLITAVGTGVTILGATNASSTTLAALSILGGLGITGNAFIGGTVTIQSTTVSSSTTTGALVVAGGIGVGGKVFADVLQSGGNTAVGGNLTVAGTVDLGNAIADSISFLGRVDTNINPIADNTYDLGVPGLAYRNASFGGSVYFTNSSNTNIFALRAGATGSTLTYVFPIDTPTAGQVLSASAPSAGVVTLSWEDDQTGAPAGGITTLNTLTTASQSFTTGTSGTDFAISSATSTHTFNLPDASASARGLVTTGTQTIAGAKTLSSALSVTASTVSTSTSTGALVVTGGVGIGGSLFTSAGSTSSVSGVLLQNGNVSASTYNKLTVTAPASSSTLTIVGGSTLITSGANSLTLTTTATTNATFPSGTKTLVATDVTSLASLTTASSLNSIGTISTGTWNGTIIAPQYGGTGLNNSGQSGILKYTTGTGSLVAAPTGAIVGTTDSQNLTNKTYNSVTITAPASSATLTLANSSSLITSGANNLTLTTTALTNVTLPAGTKTLAATDVATLSSLISVGTISTGVWSATAITAHYGGTGLQAPFVVGDILYATSTSAWGRLAASSTSGQVLTSNGAGNLPTYQAVPPAAASSVAVVPTVVNASFFIPVVNSASSSAVGLSTVSTLVINPSNNLVTLSGLAVTAVTQTTSSSTGALVVTNGAAVGQTLSVGGSLNIFNGANYTGFRFTGSASTTYTLPATSPATGSSVLQSTAAGVMSWVPMTSGGSASPGGVVDGSTQFKSGSSFGGTRSFLWTDLQKYLRLSGYSGGELYSSGEAALIVEQNYGSFNGSVNGTLIAANSVSAFTGSLLDLQVNAVSKFRIDYTGAVTVGAYSLPVVDGLSGYVLKTNGAGTVTWQADNTGGAGAGSGTVAIPNAQFGVAYYAGTGASVSGTSLMQVLTSGTAISVFTNFDLRSQNKIRFFNSGNTFSTSLHAGANTASYALALPTAPVGNGYSTILVDTSGNMFFAPLEGGLATTSVTGNRVVLRNRMEHHVWMAAGYTPLAAGADNIVYLIPDSSDDGATKITFQLKEFTIRVETPSAGSSRIQLEKSSTDTGAFTLAATGSSLIGGSGLTISGAGIYVTTTNTFVAGTFVTSGNLLRLNFNLLNATHANFSVQFTLNEV
jgi:hypothetical protein